MKKRGNTCIRNSLMLSCHVLSLSMVFALITLWRICKQQTYCFYRKKYQGGKCVLLRNKLKIKFQLLSLSSDKLYRQQRILSGCVCARARGVTTRHGSRFVDDVCSVRQETVGHFRLALNGKLITPNKIIRTIFTTPCARRVCCVVFFSHWPSSYVCHVRNLTYVYFKLEPSPDDCCYCT